MSTKPYRAVILDMDGVLTQTARLHAEAWKRMFDAYLRRRTERTGERQEPFDSEKDYTRYVDGKPRYDGVASFLNSRGIELPWGEPDDPPGRETVCGLGNRKNELFQDVLARRGVVVYEDALACLRRCRAAGIATAVITSSRNGTRILETAGLLRLLDAKIDGNDCERLGLRGKPAPDVFLRAAEELGIRPAEAVVVEDAIAGIRAGRAGNFGLVVGVARQGEGRELREAGADVVVKDLGELDSRLSASGGSG